MKVFADFYDHLLPLVPGCSRPMADLQLRIAIRDWCTRTLCWRQWLDDITTLADTPTYDFETWADQEVVQLLRGTLDGRDIDAIVPDRLPANWRSAASGLRGIFSLDGITFTLVPTPAAGLIVQTEVALRPSLTATTFEDFIFDRYAESIATGAAARLHSIPNKPYTFATSTARAQYEADVARVASDVWHAFSRAPTRVRASFL